MKQQNKTWKENIKWSKYKIEKEIKEKAKRG